MNISMNPQTDILINHHPLIQEGTSHLTTGYHVYHFALPVQQCRPSRNLPLPGQAEAALQIPGHQVEKCKEKTISCIKGSSIFRSFFSFMFKNFQSASTLRRLCLKLLQKSLQNGLAEHRSKIGRPDNKHYCFLRPFVLL